MNQVLHNGFEGTPQGTRQDMPRAIWADTRMPMET
jgi:hypothetical protein